MEGKKIVNAVMATVFAVSTAGVATQAIAKSKCPIEKCYGIVKKAKNDCGTPKHACAAQATRNADPQEWMFVMKGTCHSIVGGHLHAPKAKTQQ